MADLDRLLLPDITFVAAEAVQPPDFSLIERRGVRRRRTRTALVAAAAVVALLVAVDSSPRFLGSQGGDKVTPAVPPPPLSLPVSGEGLLEGTYLAPADESAAFPYTITFPAGWRVQGRNDFQLSEDSPNGVSILPFLVEEIYADACLGDRGTVNLVGPSRQDLVEAILAQQGPVKSRPTATTIGGYPATRINLRVPERLQDKNCFVGPGTGVQIWMNPNDRYLVLGPDGLLSIYVVDVDGRRQVFAVQHGPATTQADIARLQQIVDSIRFQP